MMKNGICSMVSDAKLCNNVANYGTKIIYHPILFLRLVSVIFGRKTEVKLKSWLMKNSETDPNVKPPN